MPKLSPTDNPFEVALLKTIDQREEHGDVLLEARRRVLAAEQRDTEIAKLARRLLKEVPRTSQQKYLREYPWLADGPDPASRQAVLIAIAQLFIASGRKPLTTPEVEKALAAQGIHANTKRIYNCLNYLAADGRLKRIERGLYAASPALKSSVPVETG